MGNETIITNGIDKYDYMLAAGSGALAGILDIIFVGQPGESKLGNRLGQAPDKYIEKAIDYFSQKKNEVDKNLDLLPKEYQSLLKDFAKDYLIKAGMKYAEAWSLSFDPEKEYTFEEYIQLLAKSADLVGIVFSIIEQFLETGEKQNKQNNICILEKKPHGFVPYLYGNDYMAKLFCGFINWLSFMIQNLVVQKQKLVSDNSRLSGIIKLISDVLNMFDIKIELPEGKKLANYLIEIFEKGYTASFAIASSMPIIMEELLIRSFWLIRQRFSRGLEWEECMPSEKNPYVRRVLLVGNGSFVLVDGADAAVRGVRDNNWGTFIGRLNFIGLARFTVLALKEAALESGLFTDESGDPLFENVFGTLTDEDKAKMTAIVEMIAAYKKALDVKQALTDALDEFEEAKAERIRIEAECEEKIKEIRKYRAEMTEYVEKYLERYMIAFEVGLSLMEEGIKEDDEEKFLKGNVLIQKTLNHDVQFETKEEFDDLMNDDSESFKL